MRAAVGPPEPCGGLSLPVVTVDQVYSFAVADLLDAIEKPESMAGEAFDRAAEDLRASTPRATRWQGGRRAVGRPSSYHGGWW
ncbi:hypothetical protein [Streptomyces sp. NPDC056194]|uniref:hypothetical protein n=1 Tax=unclassified Streptomyces TaxID=2593676 RepID=UPI0035DEFB38